jgi:hypothetical protein
MPGTPRWLEKVNWDEGKSSVGNGPETTVKIGPVTLRERKATGPCDHQRGERLTSKPHAPSGFCIEPR